MKIVIDFIARASKSLAAVAPATFPIIDPLERYGDSSHSLSHRLFFFEK